MRVGLFIFVIMLQHQTEQKFHSPVDYDHHLISTVFDLFNWESNLTNWIRMGILRERDWLRSWVNYFINATSSVSDLREGRRGYRNNLLLVNQQFVWRGWWLWDVNLSPCVTPVCLFNFQEISWRLNGEHLWILESFHLKCTWTHGFQFATIFQTLKLEFILLTYITPREINEPFKQIKCVNTREPFRRWTSRKVCRCRDRRGNRSWAETSLKWNIFAMKIQFWQLAVRRTRATRQGRRWILEGR